MDPLPEKKDASPYLAAVVQAAPVYGDVDATLHKVDALAAEAQSRGAQLAVFPEGFIGGYPKGHTFGSYVGGRTDSGREAFRRYWESAIDVPGPVVDRLGKIAREHHLMLVVGVIERGGGTLYCCVLFFDADGNCLGKHRKLMPTGAERLIWGFGDGSTLPVFDSPLGRIGAVICWENYMPLLRMAMYAKGIEIYCAPTADPRDCWLASMRHIAIEGRCFVLACNQYLLRHEVAADAPNALGEAPDTVLQRGGSCIINPFGDVLAGPDYEGEAVIVAEIDPAALTKGKFDFDVTGHYARPDIFQLHVNERPQVPVMISSGTK